MKKSFRKPPRQVASETVLARTAVSLLYRRPAADAHRQPAGGASKAIHLTHLYPVEMNIYGDTGNRIVLAKRLAWRGYRPVIHLVGVGDRLPPETDIILGGGGQDSGQNKVMDDLGARRPALIKMAENGVVMLMICGMYQLFGEYFLTQDGKKLRGIGWFNLTTHASSRRLIGNIVSKTPYGDLVGYENHSGLTKLGPEQTAFGNVPKGRGNNGEDGTEGAVKKNVFGSYLHGPILAKNPRLADELIARAVMRRYGDELDFDSLDDRLEVATAEKAKRRPR